MRERAREPARGAGRPGPRRAGSRQRLAAAGPAAARRGPPGSRSTSTRCAGNLARPARASPAGCPVHAVVKADAYGHGARPGRRVRSSRGGRRRVLRRHASTRPSSCATRGVELPILVLYPIPPEQRRGGRPAAGSPSRPATWPASSGPWPHRGGPRLGPGRRSPPGAAPLEVHLEVETGLGRGGLPGAGRRPPRPGSPPRRASGSAGVWSHLQAPEDRGPDARPGRPLRGGAVPARRRPAIDLPARHLAATRRSAGRRRRRPRRRPARPGALRPRCPTTCSADRPGRLRPARRAPAGPVAARPAGPGHRPAGRAAGSATARASRRSRPSRIATPARSATATAGRGRSRTGPRRSSAGVRVPLVGQRGDGRGHGRRHRRARPAGRRRRRIRAHRRPGRRADHAPRDVARGPHHDLLGGRHRACPGDCPGCTMPGWYRSGVRTLAGWRIACGSDSSSGTATSATSRSTRSSTRRTPPVDGDRASAGRSSGRGGDAIEFAAVRQAPVGAGRAPSSRRPAGWRPGS